MQLDFTRLQRLFIDKIKHEEELILRGQDVSFAIRTNCEFEQYRLNVRVHVFGEEFSIGYPRENTTEEELLDDCYARLHDYDTDSAKWHIIGLKIQALEKRYRESIQSLRETLLRQNPALTSADIDIDISDYAPSTCDARGFPPFGMSVLLKGKQVASQAIDFSEYNPTLAEELIEQIPG